ncbi:LysR family transcriptional regulator [Catenovulum sediminis]|uniref:LysR family transcriptional regulator n=1 Tax=Catenovulum sediminis TaxID=1740262 RepID=A0ABV1RI36_9ALTE|nr:LysR family transcriptional regulator [Catenovulum sediminis]
MKLPKTTLEQWVTFLTVLEEGGFSAAAERLNKSQSSISYNIKNLNSALPQPVMQLVGRKAQLSKSGEALQRKAKTLVELANSIEMAAQNLAQGYESDITLAIDAIVHHPSIFETLADFSDNYPQIRIKILETTLSATDEALLERQADLVFSPRIPPGFLGTPVGEVKMVAVARYDHSIFRKGEQISESELRQFRQIVIRDSGLRRNQDAGWLGAEQRWTVTNINTSIDAVKSGIGFAFLPVSFIKDELAQQQLKRIPLQNNAERVIPIYLIQAEPDCAGMGTQALFKHFVEHLKSI